jgi:hypothetical protein
MVEQRGIEPLASALQKYWTTNPLKRPMLFDQ